VVETVPRGERNCTQCGSPKLVRDYGRAAIVCSECGFVVEERIGDPGPEWRNFGDGAKNRSRVGPPLAETIHDYGLSTEVGRGRRDARGGELPPERLSQLRRLRRWDRRARFTNSDRTLARGFVEQGRLCSQLTLPSSVRNRAAAIYRRALKHGSVRGRSVETIATAAVQCACRELGFHRDPNEFETASRIGRNAAKRAQKLLIRELGFSISVSNPSLYVHPAAHRLGVSRMARGRACAIAEHVQESGLITGREPRSVAAAALYLSCKNTDEGVTQGQVAEVTGVSRTTVEKICSVISPWFKKKTGVK